MQTVRPKQTASKRCKIKAYAIPLIDINISSMYIKSWFVGDRFSCSPKTFFVAFHDLRGLDRCNSSRSE